MKHEKSDMGSTLSYAILPVGYKIVLLYRACKNCYIQKPDLNVPLAIHPLLTAVYVQLSDY